MEQPYETEAPEAAKRCAVSIEAVELVRASEVIDLHLESFIPPRLWGYRLSERHDHHWLGGRGFGHLDFPRALDGGLTGAMWSIATNIARSASGRWRALRSNVEALRQELLSYPGITVVRTSAEFRAARERGEHAAMISVQGGNAYEGGPGADALEDVVRVTVMHLSDSCFGHTSSPASVGRSEGLTSRGREYIEQLDAARIFVDLAHIDRQGFWDAVDVHDSSLPLIDTHTGVTGVLEHWRNIDDAQCRAIAETGGVVGIIFEPRFLRRRGQGLDGEMVLDHLEHLIRVAGEGSAAIGSDYDGAITPPPELRDGFSAYYRLTQRMLERGWSEDRIRNVLGLNFLRAFRALR